MKALVTLKYYIACKCKYINRVSKAWILVNANYIKKPQNIMNF